MENMSMPQLANLPDSKFIMTYLTQPEDANPAGTFHAGNLMKLIDNAAGVATMRFCRSECVTATVDRIDFIEPIYIGEMLTLKCAVNHVGGKSMEIGTRVEAENLVNGQVRHVARAYITYVPLDSNHKPSAPPPLALYSQNDIRRHQQAARRYQANKERRGKV